MFIHKKLHTMFDIRKMQEQVIYNALKKECDDSIAEKIVNGYHEDNPTWVKNTMKRLEEFFDKPTVKRIRMNCQCGHGMDEKLALLKEIKEISSNLEEFGNHPRAKGAGLSFSRAFFTYNSHSAHALCLPRLTGWRVIHGANALRVIARLFSKKHLVVRSMLNY
jgi:hypothetical protein